MNNFSWDHTKHRTFVGNPTISTSDFLELLASRFRSIGAEHILITGLPLPGRDLGKLVLFQQWGPSELSLSQLAQISGSDALLRRVAVLDASEKWQLSKEENKWLHGSALLQILKRSAENVRSYQSLIGIHIHNFDHMQIAIFIAGEILDISARELTEMSMNLRLEMIEMHEVSPILTHRPGELSSREKLVLSLTAEGKTAGIIAEELQISQRTVHAHLQNASEKMQAANKTQTVVEAMRYGQIQLR